MGLLLLFIRTRLRAKERKKRQLQHRHRRRRTSFNVKRSSSSFLYYFLFRSVVGPMPASQITATPSGDLFQETPTVFAAEPPTEFCQCLRTKNFARVRVLRNNICIKTLPLQEILTFDKSQKTDFFIISIVVSSFWLHASIWKLQLSRYQIKVFKTELS